MPQLNLTSCDFMQLEKSLMLYYTNAVGKYKNDLTLIQSIMLWSLPGIGKSQFIRHIAGLIEEKTGKRVEVVELRLSECTLLELVGLMHIDPDSKEVLYDMPPSFKDNNPDGITIILFDELDKAKKELQNAALRLILDKAFWQYELPKNAIAIACGNPENIDGEMFSNFSAPLNNRFRHYLIQPDYKSWEKWALENNIHPLVHSFLNAHQDFLYSEDAGANNAVFNTPRSWTMVSDYLNIAFGENKIDWSIAFLDIGGMIGNEHAAQFRKFCKNASLMPAIEDILNGTDRTIPKATDVKFAVMKSLVDYIGKNRTSMKQINWALAREYADNFPLEFAVYFYKSIQSDKQLQRQMIYHMTDDERSFWKKKYGAALMQGAV